MTVDDDIKYQHQAQQTPQQYLDFIEFCLAEYNADYFTNDLSPSSIQPALSTQTQYEVNIRNKRKWSKNKIVDLNILNSYQTRLKDNFEIFQEHLLLHKIKDINQFSSIIPLSVFFQNAEMSSSYFSFQNRNKINYSIINTKKKLFIDMKTLKILNKSKQINWSSSLISLYPVKTLGDGNCLCHAVLSYLIGMQDINLALRETLKNFMNNIEYTTELKYRWVSYRKASDVANSIQIDDKILDMEWSEIINMKSATGQSDSHSQHNESLTGLDKSASTILTSDSSSKQLSSNSSSSQSLIYLEDIHIFALANLLYRTIIVISLDTIRNIQPIHLRGIYLPLLRRPDECVKDPILIAFHNFHFMPLLFPVDDDNKEENTSEFVNTEKYFHFENIDEMDLKELDSSEYENFFRFNIPNPSKNPAATNMSSSCVLNPGMSAKRKKSRFYNTLPLYYYNLEPMKIHFLKESEEKKGNDYLFKYLNLIQLEITIDDLHPSHFDFLNENQTITVLCCYLQKDNSRGKRIKTDGITTYLNFLNDSIKKNGYKVTASKSINDDVIVPTSPSRVATSTSTVIPIITSPSNDRHDNYDTNRKCKSESCNEKALEVSSYYGYCYKCFKKHMSSMNSSNTTENSNRSKKEVEAEKETQQTQYVTTQPPTPVPTTPTPVPVREETNISHNEKESSNEKIQTSSSKLLEVNRKLAVNSSRPTSKLEICSSARCKNVVQNPNDELCSACKESFIADAMRSTSSASNIRTPITKPTERISTPRLITSNKSSIQIPVKHESNNTASSKISAYNMVNDSKLYKTPNLTRSNLYDDVQSNYNNRMGNFGKVNNLNYLEESDYDNATTSRFGQIHDLRRSNMYTPDSFSFQTRNITFPICSNCKNPLVDRTGASSFCNLCRMNPYSKLYF